MKTSIKNKTIFILGILLLLVIWEIVSVSYDKDIVFPSLFQIGEGLKEILVQSRTYKVIGMTLLRLFIAIIISILMAIFFSSLAKRFGWFNKLIAPLIGVIKSVPVASFIIIVLVIIGHERSSIVISILVVFPIMYEGFLNAMNTVNKEIRDEIKMISGINGMVIKDVYLPIVMPYVATTLLQSVSLGIKSLVMAELLTMPKISIGSEMLTLKNNLEMNKIMAWTIILILISMVFEVLLNVVKNKYIDQN